MVEDDEAAEAAIAAVLEARRMAWNAGTPPVGTWTVEGEQLCLLRAQSRCYLPVWADQQIKLFDQYGVMQIDAVALPQ